MSAEIIHGDCLEVMRGMPENSVDAVVTDPPYGTTEEGKSKVSGRPSDGFPKFGFDWDTELPLEWLAEASRILRPGGAVIAWTDNKRLGDVWAAFENANIRPLKCFFWHKTNPPTNPRKNFCSAVETAVFGRKSGLVLCWNGGGATHNHFTGPNVHGAHRVHPTQKPLLLMRHLVRLVVPIGGVVLDPFAGSGTTVVAAHLEDRSAIGIEKDEHYAEIARKRVAEATAQRRLPA